MLSVGKPVRSWWSAREFTIGSKAVRWLCVLEAASLGFEIDRFIEHIDFFIGVGIVDKFSIVIVILTGLHEWLVGYRNSKLVSFYLGRMSEQANSNLPRVHIGEINLLGALTESSEVLRLVLRCVLRQKPFPRFNVVTYRMLLTNGHGRAVAVGAGEQVLADQSFDVARVARHLLVPYLVVRPVHPIFRVTTHVAENDLVLVDGWNEI